MVNGDMENPGQRLIGELLVQQGVVRESEVERALDLQRDVGGRLGSLLMRLGALSEEQGFAVVKPVFI